VSTYSYRQNKITYHKMDLRYFAVHSYKQFLYHKNVSLTQQTDRSYKHVGPNLEYHEALKAITMFYTGVVSTVAVFKWIYGLSRSYAPNMHGRAFVYLCSSLITFSALCLSLIHRLASTALAGPACLSDWEYFVETFHSISTTIYRLLECLNESITPINPWSWRSFWNASLCVLVNR
jgi:hypothetical protein